MGMGAGYGRVVAEGSVADQDVKATYTGFGPALELLIGGTIGSGFVLGGGFAGQDLSEPDVEVETQDDTLSDTMDNEALGISVVGVFLDWFPDPKGGAHVGLMVGPASIGLQDDNNDSASVIGGALFGGYDFWVGDQWSLGAQARVVMASADHDRLDNTFDDSALGGQLLFSALLH